MNEEKKIIEKIEELSKEHRELDSYIDELIAKPNTDFLKVKKLKKNKLLLKDQIERLRSELYPDIIA